jgi:hypothetical protein
LKLQKHKLVPQLPGDTTNMHPSQKFYAPKRITAGEPLEALMSPFLCECIAESTILAYPEFMMQDFL